MKKKIAIIGSGVAGLVLGNLLKKSQSCDFMIYEKEDGLRFNEGYGIQLSTNSISILNEIDFDNIDEKQVFNPNKINFFSIKNKKICELDLNVFNRPDVKYTTLRRSTLVEFLKEKIYKNNLKFNKVVKKISELKGKMLINFEDNTNDLVDYICVCDGVFSNTKTIIEKKNYKPKYSGSVAIRKILKSPNLEGFDNQNISIYMGSNSHIVSYPINMKGDLNLVLISRTKFNSENINSILEKNILNQNKKFSKIFSEDAKSWPIYVSNKIIKPKNEKVFYLGDAFHTLLPTMAQGASQSIEDAYELSLLLSKNVTNAHVTYYDKRSKKINSIIYRSKLNYFSFHLSNSLLSKIRNYLMKTMTKNKKFLNLYLGKVYN